MQTVPYARNTQQKNVQCKGRWFDNDIIDSIRWKYATAMEDAWYVNPLQREIAKAKEDNQVA